MSLEELSKRAKIKKKFIIYLREYLNFEKTNYTLDRIELINIFGNQYERYNSYAIVKDINSDKRKFISLKDVNNYLKYKTIFNDMIKLTGICNSSVERINFYKFKIKDSRIDISKDIKRYIDSKINKRIIT